MKITLTDSLSCVHANIPNLFNAATGTIGVFLLLDLMNEQRKNVSQTVVMMAIHFIMLKYARKTWSRNTIARESNGAFQQTILYIYMCKQKCLLQFYSMSTAQKYCTNLKEMCIFRYLTAVPSRFVSLFMQCSRKSFALWLHFSFTFR